MNTILTFPTTALRLSTQSPQPAIPRNTSMVLLPLNTTHRIGSCQDPDWEPSKSLIKKTHSMSWLTVKRLYFLTLPLLQNYPLPASHFLHYVFPDLDTLAIESHKMNPIYRIRKTHRYLDHRKQFPRLHLVKVYT